MRGRARNAARARARNRDERASRRRRYGNDWGASSPIFRSDWFGRVESNESEGYVINEGWFAYTPVPTNRSRPVHNSYGRITTSINNDPSQYVTRSHQFCGMPVNMPLPGCKEMVGCLTTNNLVDLHYCLEDELHGDLHAILGGAWDCGVPITRVTPISKNSLFQEQLGRMGCKAKPIWNKARARAGSQRGVLVPTV